MQTVLIIVAIGSVVCSFGLGIYIAVQDSMGIVTVTKRTNKHGEDF